VVENISNVEDQIIVHRTSCARSVFVLQNDEGNNTVVPDGGVLSTNEGEGLTLHQWPGNRTRCMK